MIIDQTSSKLEQGYRKTYGIHTLFRSNEINK